MTLKVSLETTLLTRPFLVKKYVIVKAEIFELKKSKNILFLILNEFLIDFWSRVVKFFDIKKTSKYSRFFVGVDPVELRENPRPAACKEKKTHFQIFNSQSID